MIEGSAAAAVPLLFARAMFREIMHDIVSPLELIGPDPLYNFTTEMLLRSCDQHENDSERTLFMLFAGNLISECNGRLE